MKKLLDMASGLRVKLLMSPFSAEKMRMDMLTAREVEVVALAAEGYENINIAAVLGISNKTVDSHMTNIYRKLDVRNRAQLTRWWMTQDQYCVEYDMEQLA